MNKVITVCTMPASSAPNPYSSKLRKMCWNPKALMSFFFKRNMYFVCRDKQLMCLRVVCNFRTFAKNSKKAREKVSSLRHETLFHIFILCFPALIYCNRSMEPQAVADSTAHVTARGGLLA